MADHFGTRHMKTETSQGGLKSQDAQNEWPDGSVVRKK